MTAVLTSGAMNQSSRFRVPFGIGGDLELALAGHLETLIAIAAGLSVIFLIHRIGMSPARHRVTVATLGRFIRALYFSGYDHGQLVLKVNAHYRDRRTLRLRKIIHAPGKVSLELGFPREQRLEEYVPQVKQALARIRGDSSLEPHTVDSSFYWFECGAGIIGAEHCVRVLLENVFGMTPETRIVGYLVDVHYKPVRIGFS